MSKNITIGESGTASTLTVGSPGTTTTTLKGTTVNVIGTFTGITSSGNITATTGSLVGTSVVAPTYGPAANEDVSFCALSTGTINIGTGTRTGTGAINIGTGAGSTGAINIGVKNDIATTGTPLTLNGSTIAIEPEQTKVMNIATAQTTGQLNIGTGLRTTGAINIGTGVGSTGAINIGVKNDTIGTPLTLNGSTIAIEPVKTQDMNIATAQSTGTLNIGTGGRTGTGAINIGTGLRTGAGAINIGTGAGSTGPINIGAGPTGTTTTLNGIVNTNVGTIAGKITDFNVDIGGLNVGYTGTTNVYPATLNMNSYMYFWGAGYATAFNNYRIETGGVNGQEITFKHTGAQTIPLYFSNTIVLNTSLSGVNTTTLTPGSTLVVFFMNNKWFEKNATTSLSLTSTLTAPSITAPSTLSIGTSTATSVSIGSSTIPTTINGKLGIGITPSAPLHIYEPIGTSVSTTTGSIILDHGNLGGTSSILFKSRVNSSSDYGYIYYVDDINGSGGEQSALCVGTENDIADSAKDVLVLNRNGGYVGIGKTNPSTLLDVNGVITATTMAVTDFITLPIITKTPGPTQLGYNGSVTISAEVAVEGNLMTQVITTGSILPIGIYTISVILVEVINPNTTAQTTRFSFTSANTTLIGLPPANDLCIMGNGGGANRYPLTLTFIAKVTTQYGRITLSCINSVGMNSSFFPNNAIISYIKIA